MGFFSGLKRRLKDGSLVNSLQAAGAIANGDYATAAQIKGLYQRQRDEEAEKQAKAQAAEAAVAALVRQGVPEPDARVLVQTGAADTVLAKKYEPAPLNDTERDYNFWKEVLTPEQFETWKQNRIDPPEYRQGGDGRYYRVQKAPTPPDTLPADFNFGGPTPPASGNFLDAFSEFLR